MPLETYQRPQRSRLGRATRRSFRVSLRDTTDIARTVDDLQNAHGVPPDECDAMRAFVAAGADAATLARLAREVARHDHFDATRAAAFARTLGILARRFLPPPPPAKK